MFAPKRNLYQGRTKKVILLRQLVLPGLVEPDGIEPTTSCLQSTRSPN